MYNWAADKVERRDVKGLIPYARNSRTHSEEQIGQIAASIKEWGWTTPVLVSEDGTIIAGHGRILAAQKLGIDTVPVMVANGWTEAQIKAYVIADNKLAENAGWDTDMLSIELKELEGLEFDLDLIGFDKDALADLTAVHVEGLTDEDAVPELQERAVSVLGDVWILGNHRLMCGDSTSIDAVEKLMDGQKADMVFTDPPYGIGLDGDSIKIGKSKSYRGVLNDNNSDVARDAYSLVLSMGVGVRFFWGANHYSNVFEPSTCWIVWDKQGGKSVTYADCELCYTNMQSPVRMFTHIWDGFRRDSEVGKSRVHPTQKPVELIVQIWEKFSSPVSVMDLFGGSGSTLIACEKTNRKCFMMELDEKYVDVIIRRWQDFTGREATHAESGKTFAEISNDQA